MAGCNNSGDHVKGFGKTKSEDEHSDFDDLYDSEEFGDFFGDDYSLDPEAFPANEGGFGSFYNYLDTGLDSDNDDDDDDASLCDLGDDATANAQWSTDLHSYKPADFSGPPPGPTRPLEAAAKELDFFYLMFPPSLIEHLVEETNRFAAQKLDGNPNAPRWKPVSIDEMKAFLGIRIYMSVAVLPDTRMYFTANKFSRKFDVSNVMNPKRFKEISVHFCANNQMKQCPKGDLEHDKLYEVKPVLDAVLARCLHEYNPHQSCLLYASTVSYAGLVVFYHFIPRKPYNMRILVRADSVSGYCCEFQAYIGQVTPEDQEKEPEMRLPSRMVFELCQKLKGFHYVITMDSYFTSPLLVKKLHSLDILARGTVCRKLKGFTHALLSQTLTQKVAKQGDCAFAQQGNLSACAYSWCNRHVVRLISTADDPTVKSTLEWEHRGEKKVVPYPSVLQVFNDSIGRMQGLDRSRIDFPTARASKKWWVYLFWYLFDIAVYNAFILKESQAHQRTIRTGLSRKTLTIREFRKKLCVQLMAHT